ncbi:MAG: hypothetical protein UY23_C0001G0225 [Candidatus Jorgensenbacteria bacterium GW2011_GWA1_48_11]|uniref:Uncharacterized protein n=1 Tax=Candidatus Jorgensenbacteria bacterium GW2011_GWA1_48_11 TaxID=1618660 RepID=A0A0G1UBY4_9BACT|nr:MAG: hypothetical protein UY23_C0001G0225 [Candidatus Jorgensenbacteria bacterium GW2011_GWA1_48_11]KKW12111.1 MAG: hypothetical protein UY51_C0005G0353 [Candidatus Jorgensenbacteria bacterium GW2011_GWB1_49_9]
MSQAGHEVVGWGPDGKSVRCRCGRWHAVGDDGQPDFASVVSAPIGYANQWPDNLGFEPCF